MRVRHGFTIIEMLVVLVIIGVMMSTLMPLISKRRTVVNWESVGDRLNEMALFIRAEAMSTHKTYRFVFQHSHETVQDQIFLEEEYIDPEKPNQHSYRDVTSYYAPTRYELPPEYKLRAVYVGKENTLPEPRGQAYCFIIPDGLMQPVIVHLVKKEDKAESLVSYQLNPFLGKFALHEGKVKPE